MYVAVVGLTFFKYQLDQVDSGFQSFVSSLIFFPTFFLNQVLREGVNFYEY